MGRVFFFLLLTADLSASGAAKRVPALNGHSRAAVAVLEHKIRLQDSWGRAVIDGGGLRYHHDRLMAGYMTQDLSQVFPRVHWGEYDLFYVGGAMRYQIFFRNKTSRSYRNLRITAWQEHLKPDGSWEPQEGPDDEREWTIAELTADGMLVLNGEVAVPLTPRHSGLVRTRFQAEYVDDSRPDRLTRRLLAEDGIATLWCPSEFKPRLQP